MPRTKPASESTTTAERLAALEEAGRESERRREQFFTHDLPSMRTALTALSDKVATSAQVEKLEGTVQTLSVTVSNLSNGHASTKEKTEKLEERLGKIETKQNQMDGVLGIAKFIGFGNIILIIMLLGFAGLGLLMLRTGQGSGGTTVVPITGH